MRKYVLATAIVAAAIALLGTSSYERCLQAVPGKNAVIFANVCNPSASFKIASSHIPEVEIGD